MNKYDLLNHTAYIVLCIGYVLSGKPAYLILAVGNLIGAYAGWKLRVTSVLVWSLVFAIISLIKLL